MKLSEMKLSDEIERGDRPRPAFDSNATNHRPFAKHDRAIGARDRHVPLGQETTTVSDLIRKGRGRTVGLGDRVIGAKWR